MSSLALKIGALDAEALGGLAGKASGRQGLRPLSWTVEPLLHHARHITAGVYRFAGRGLDGGEAVPWSLVLKVIRPAAAFSKLSSCFYWKREALVFNSGLLDELDGGLMAVRCLEVSEQEDGSIWLWLEDVAEDHAGWDLGRHGLAAYHFGVFNGSYFAGRPLPEQAWLSRSFLRSWLSDYLGFGALEALQDPELRRHPAVARAFPRAEIERARALINEREPLLRALEREPRTLAHLDAHRPNLFSQAKGGAARTVAIDWAALGLAAAGEELGMQVLGNLFILEVAPDEAPRYSKAAFEAYREGLYQAGWRGDDHSVRFAFALAGALRYAVFIPLQLQAFAREGKLPLWGASWAKKRGLSHEEAIRWWGESWRYMLELAEEAKADLS
jgi:hypothetical protein